MLLSIAKLDIGPNPFRFDFGADDLSFDYRGVRLEGDWRVEGEAVKNSKEEVMLRGRLTGVAATECDRCLTPFRMEIDAPFTLYLIPAAGLRGAPPQERQVEAEAVDESVYHDAEIRLDEVAAEQIILALPDKLLCGGECRGLCPRCGSNLNEEPCRCVIRTDDPRWQLLREMQRRSRRQ